MRIRTPTRQIVRSLGSLSKKWLRSNFEYRQVALKELESRCDYPKAMAEKILDGLFSELTEKKLWAMLENELGEPEVLDRFRSDRKNSRSVRAFGPGTITHVFSANVPNPSVVSIVLGLLTKSFNVAKLSSEDSGLLEVYLKSLRRHDPMLAQACTIFRGREIEKTLRKSGAVIVYGGNESIAHFLGKISPNQIFIPYGHRMSFGIYLKGALSSDKIAKLAEKTADDLWLMDQRGCLSPLAIFLQKERNGAIFFCEALSRALKKRGERPSTDQNSARLHVLKNKNNRAWSVGGWLVLYDNDPSNRPISWGGRTVVVKSFDSSKAVIRSLRTFSSYLQAATLEGGSEERRRMAEALAGLGFNRICRAGDIQKPPLSWHHDGRMNLAPLLRWTDLEDP